MNQTLRVKSVGVQNFEPLQLPVEQTFLSVPTKNLKDGSRKL